MQRAKAYIDQLANGINPIDGTSVADSDVINNVRISRCLFYVSDILKRVIDNGGSISKKKVAKGPFFLPSEAAKGFRFQNADNRQRNCQTYKFISGFGALLSAEAYLRHNMAYRNRGA